jgi:ribosomal protein L3
MRTRTAPYFALLLAATVVATACGRKASGGTAAVSVTEIDLGRSLKPDLTIDDKTDTFNSNDVIYASIETKGSGPATLAARWTFDDNQLVDESSRTISPTGDGPARTEFHVSKPGGWPTGTYHLTVTLNGATAGTKDFEVK